MNSITIQIFSPFGFHTEQTAAAHQTTFRDSKTGEIKPINPLEGAYQHNLTVILGYIPLIGSLIGFIRIMAGIAYVIMCNKGLVESPEPALGGAMIARGVVELLSCGILLLVIDLIVSLGRILCQCGASQITTP